MNISTKEFLEIVETELKDFFQEEDRNDLEIIQVWYCKTIQNHKGLFIVKNLEQNMIYSNFIEVTYNGDIGELYLDFYKKEFKHTIKLKDKF